MSYLLWNSASQRLQDVIHHLLGVIEQHHGVVAEEPFVLDAGVARAHPALDEQNGLRPVNVQDRHAEDRRLRISLRRRIGTAPAPSPNPPLSSASAWPAPPKPTRSVSQIHELGNPLTTYSTQSVHTA